MRRFISYLLLGAATLIGVGAAITPTVLRMDADMAYAEGQTLYFKASEWDETSINGNYTGADGHFLDYDAALSKQPIEYIAETMRARLDAFELSGYSVKTEGADTVTVTVRTPRNNATLYTYLQRYLSFSGGNYELDASDTTKEGYAYNENWSTILDGQTAFIADMEQGTYNVPTVIVPLKSGEDYKDAFLSLVDYCKNNSSEADSESGTAAVSVNILVWANRGEADVYSDANENPNIAAKIVSAVNPNNAVYYDSGDTEQNTPYLRLIPVSSATSSGESYDPSKTQEAYDAARNLMLTINAGAFQYDELKASSQEEAPKFAVSFAYSETATASVERLVNNGEWNQSLALSATLISFGVALVLLVVLLAVFERMLAILELSIVAISVLSTLAVYAAFGTPFGLPMLLGLGVTALLALFSGLYYSSKLKEEIYKGRTLKKAHSEAAKKSLMPIVDGGVIAILVGICVYGLAGDVASKFGVVLALGGFFTMIASLLYTRLGGFLLCSDNTASVKFPKWLRIRQNRVPDLAKQEKQTYFGAFAENKFSRGKIVALTFSTLMLLAGVGSAIGWGIASSGTSFFNSSSFENASPVLRLDVRSNASDRITVSSLSEVSDLLDDTYKEGAPTDVFHTYKINDSFLADYVSSVTLSKSPKSVYLEEGDTGLTYYWFYYEATLSKKDATVFKNAIKEGSEFTLSKWNGTEYATLPNFTLSDLAGDIISEFVGGSIESLDAGAYTDDVYITFDAVIPEALTPYLWQVTLALGVAAATIMTYMVLRFRPSRGLVAGLFSAGTATIAVSFFILTRIVTLPIVSIAGGVTLVLTAIIALAMLSGEKEIYRESKEKEKDNVAFRANCLKLSASRGAEYTFLFALVSAICFISFLAFGPSAYQPTFLAVILGIAFAVALTVTALPSLSGKVAAALPSFKFSGTRRRKKKAVKAGGQLMKKNKTGEPEESVFIGIND